MDWPQLGKRLAAGGLPALGAALAGPTGASVGRQIAARIGAADAEPAVIAQAIAADPEVAARLAELEVELETERRETLKVTTAAAKEEAVINEENIREARLTQNLNPMRLLLLCGMMLVLILSVVGLTVAWLLVDEFPPELFGLIGTVIGMLVTKASSGWDYFFGTSSGSAAKERAAQIERLAEKR